MFPVSSRRKMQIQMKVVRGELGERLCIYAVCCTTDLCLWRAPGAGQDLSVGKEQLNDDCLGIRPHMFAQVQFENS